MKILKSVMILLIFLNFGYSYSQNMNDFEKKSREKADLVFEKIAKSQSENLPYVLFSIANSDYLIIIDRKTHYTQINAILSSNDSIEIKSVKSIKKSNKILEKVFNLSNYQKDFIGFESDFYKGGYELASGGTTYFVMKDNNRNRFGESSLSIIVKPNPIDLEIYNYLTSELISL